MSLWLDYSFARPYIQQMKADGVAGVLRYLAPDDANNGGKILRPDERDSLLSAGFDIALNWEWYAGRALDGYAAGVQDGNAAAAQAAALGYPANKEIYFSHDTSTFNQSVLDYFRGAKDALGSRYQSGGYGSFYAIQQLHAAGLITRGWQTTAWSNGNRDPWAVIYQDGKQWYNGAADEDIITSADIGSWLDGPGGLVSAEYDALKKQIDNLAEMLINDATHAGHRSQAEAQQLARQEIAAVKTVVDDLDIRLASLQKQVDGLQAGAGQVDVAALAAAEADELAKRLAS